MHSRTPVTRTLKGNEKQSKLARVQVIGVDWKIQFATLQLLFDQGQGILVRDSGEFELSQLTSWPSKNYWKVGWNQGEMKLSSS